MSCDGEEEEVASASGTAAKASAESPLVSGAVGDQLPVTMSTQAGSWRIRSPEQCMESMEAHIASLWWHVGEGVYGHGAATLGADRRVEQGRRNVLEWMAGTQRAVECIIGSGVHGFVGRGLARAPFRCGQAAKTGGRVVEAAGCTSA